MTVRVDAVTVTLGDTVTWTNAGGTHNVQFRRDARGKCPTAAPAGR